MAISAFLRCSKSKILARELFGSVVHVVTGNEACDLDSAASAICLSFHLKHQTREKDNIVHIPLLNIPRKDYRIRTEVKYLLDDVGIDENDLCFLDDINLKLLHEKKLLTMSLVDLSVLPAEQEYLNDVVTQVIDHHANKRTISDNADVTIETVGSCATLVSEYVLKHGHINDETMAKLLYGAILIDTSCLKDNSKTTEKDICIINKLEKLHPDFNRDKLYINILTAKDQIIGLTFSELIRKDLKFIDKIMNNKTVRIAISVIRMSIHSFFKEHPDIEEIYKKQLEALNSMVLVIMFVDTQTTLRRFLALYTNEKDIANQLIDGLANNKSIDLKLEKIKTENSGNFLCFEQLNVLASRKIILPILENV